MNDSTYFILGHLINFISNYYIPIVIVAGIGMFCLGYSLAVSGS